MSVELKPCPFCGGGDIRFDLHSKAGRGEHQGDDVWSMCCVSCGAQVPNRYNDYGKGLMVAAWNRRADLAPDAAYVGALQSIAANTCCGPCQEAALVARAALAAKPQAAPVRVVTVDQLERWMSYTSQHGGSANCLKEIRAIIAGQP